MDTVSPPLETATTPGQRRQVAWFGALAILLVATMAAAYVYETVSLKRIMRGAAITPAEASQLQHSLGLVNSYMRIQERKGSRIEREVTPLPDGGGTVGQDVTFTVTPAGGEPIVYQFGYMLISDPAMPGADRSLEIYPLNATGQALLDELFIPYVPAKSPPTPEPSQQD